MDNSGPVIRYRVATELCPGIEPNCPLDDVRLRSRTVRYWLDIMGSDCGRSGLHGANSGTFENVMGKLYELGFRQGMPDLDRRTQPFRQWMAGDADTTNGYLPVFHRTLTASFLAMTGYGSEEGVDAWLKRRLRTLYRFARKGDLSTVYVPQDTYPGFPKAFRTSPLVNPDLYPEEDLQLPWVHDLYAFLHSNTIMGDPDLREKVDAVIGLVLSPGYQSLRPGYGVVRHGRRYYMMGWSIHLPGYFGDEVSGPELGRMLLLLKLLGRSERAREHRWYRRSVDMLSRFSDDNGLFCFPRGSLLEKRTGVWVLGARMGLEEERRTLRSIKCESTFRWLEIAAQGRRVQ